MKRNCSLIILLFLATITSHTFGQDYYKSGYYIDSIGIRHETNISSINYSLEYMLVKDNLELEADTIYAHSVAEVGIGDHTRYVSFETGGVNVEIIETDWTLVVDGEVSLFEHRTLGKKTYYYQIGDEDKVLLEFEDQSGKAGRDKFRQQIWEQFSCESISIEFLKEVSYNKLDLTKLFKRINRCIDADYEVVNTKIVVTNETTKEKVFAFIRLIVDSELQLLELDDFDETKFYIRKQGSMELELLRFEQYYEGSRKITKRYYLNQIRKALLCSNVSVEADYSRGDLVKFISTCLESKELSFETYLGTSETFTYWRWMSIRPKGGLSFNNFTIPINRSRNVVFSGIGLSAGVELVLTPPKNQVFSLIGQFDLKYTGKQEEFNFGQLKFRYPSSEILLGGRLNLINSNETILGISGGLNMVIPIATKLQFGEDAEIERMKGFYSTPFLSGSLVYKGYLVEYRWESQASVQVVQTSYLQYNVSKNSIQIGYILR